MKLFSDRPDRTSSGQTPNKSAAPRAARGQSNRPAPEESPARRSGGKKAIIICSVVLAVLVAGAFLFGAYANGLETIYPNISMEGTDLSGMTQQQAEQALAAGALGNQEDKTFTVLLPAGCEMNISAKQAGCFVSAPEAAQAVYDLCHKGGFFGNTITYIRAQLGGIDLKTADLTSLNEDYIRSESQAAAKKVTEALKDSDLQIGEDSIVLIKGADAVLVDATKLYEAVKEALESGQSDQLKYVLEQDGQSDKEINIDQLYDSIFAEAENSVYDPKTKSATDHKVGISFDKQQAEALLSAAANGDRVEIPLIKTEPEVTKEKLTAMLFADLLAQKSTTLSGSSSARINNIKKASAAINGLILNPGDEFSYNGTVGQRTAAGGYQAAGAYSGGKVVSEIGGGICQVSSTLYYCTLLSNLEIVQRTCHYFGVNYLPAGLDATVSWPSPDFKFKNSGAYPIKITAGVDGGNLTVQIYGSNPDGIKVEMTVDRWNTSNGYGTQSYRLVYDRDGKLISKKEEAKSEYHFHTPEPSPSPSTSPSPSVNPSEAPSATPAPTATTTPTATPAPTPQPTATPPAIMPVE